MPIPDLAGGSILNVIAELERRLVGAAPSPGLHPRLASLIPAADTYVVIFFDGLGDAQLDHLAARGLAVDRVATVDAPFPTTTTVSLASVATGLPPVAHGLIGYLLDLPGYGIVNTIKWTERSGVPIDLDTAGFLPTPNLWERLAAGGAEPITVQPGDFIESALTRALYRGARYEPVWSVGEVVDAVATLAGVPGRLLFAYLPHVDFAAHVGGQQAAGYADAMRTVTGAWEQMRNRLPANAQLIGIADHGHVDFEETGKVVINKQAARGLRIYGDPRSLYVRGEQDAIARLGATLPATWHPLDEMLPWLGDAPAHPDLAERLPSGVFLADDGKLLLPGHMDRRLIGYHGGLTEPEVKVPLLVAPSG